MNIIKLIRPAILPLTILIAGVAGYHVPLLFPDSTVAVIFTAFLIGGVFGLIGSKLYRMLRTLEDK